MIIEEFPVLSGIAPGGMIYFCSTKHWTHRAEGSHSLCILITNMKSEICMLAAAFTSIASPYFNPFYRRNHLISHHMCRHSMQAKRQIYI